MTSRPPTRRLALTLADLLACYLACASIASCFPEPGIEWDVVVPVSALSCWLAALAFQERDFGFNLWIDQFFYACGLNMLLEYGLAYAFMFRPAPLAAMLAGVALALILMASLHRWVFPDSRRSPTSVLFIGFDASARALAPLYGDRIVGVLEDDPARVPSGLPYLGPPSRLDEAVARTQPGSIVVTGRPASASGLLDKQYSGCTVIDGSALHETMLERVRWDRLRPIDLLFSHSTNADRLGMAVQAIYNNLVGLALLLVSTPLLFLLGLGVSVASGGGPSLESTECLGFQMIPFRLLRFSLGRTGAPPNAVGRLISKLHLVHLPRLINVVRGEMALFGPPPVRRNSPRAWRN